MKLKYYLFHNTIVLLCLVFSPIKEKLIAEEVNFAHALVTTSTGIEIPVEVADTYGKRRLGLGNRLILKKNWGMLFVFEKRKAHRFWMKNMKFPLDIIWLDNYRIVHILKNVQPAKFGEIPPILEPLMPANFVLEIAAGRSTELKLKKGDLLKYKF